jgi:hypothetical protein
MEGMQNMPLVEQLAVAYEVSLYDQWFRRKQIYYPVDN